MLAPLIPPTTDVTTAYCIEVRFSTKGPLNFDARGSRGANVVVADRVSELEPSAHKRSSANLQIPRDSARVLLTVCTCGMHWLSQKYNAFLLLVPFMHKKSVRLIFDASESLLTSSTYLIRSGSGWNDISQESAMGEQYHVVARSLAISIK